MPRIPRNYITTPYYHVMCQGIKKELIFNDSENMDKYLALVNKYKNEFLVSVVTYCLMPNHVHLLLHTDRIENLSSFMHKLNCTYGMYYNKLNERVGYVFRNRFRTEGVSGYKYLVNCIEYIHNNPVKAGLCNNISDYCYSGYKEFTGKKVTIDKNIADEITRNRTFVRIESIDAEKINFIDIDVDEMKIAHEIAKDFCRRRSVELEEVLKNDTLLQSLLSNLIIRNNLSYSCVEKSFKIYRKKIADICPKKGQV